MHPEANKHQIREALAEAVRRDGDRRPHHADAPARGHPRPDARHDGALEEGDRRRSRTARRCRSSRAEMSIRQFRPMTAGTRFRSVSGFDEITRGTPEKSLLEPLEAVGRPQQHRATSRRGTRAAGTSAVPEDRLQARTSSGFRARSPRSSTIRTARARIALLVYADGEKRYILHPKGLEVRATIVMSGPGSDIRLGNALPLAEIPLGTTVHNIELKIGKGGQMARSAGAGVPGGGQGRRVRHAAPPVDRDAPGARALPRHDRRGGQRRARAAVGRQGRQEPLAGQAVRRCAASP